MVDELQPEMQWSQTLGCSPEWGVGRRVCHWLYKYCFLPLATLSPNILNERCRSITLIQSNMASKEGGAAAAPGPNPTGAFYPSQGDNWIAHDSVQANVLCVHSAMTPQLSSCCKAPRRSRLYGGNPRSGACCVGIKRRRATTRVHCGRASPA